MTLRGVPEAAYRYLLGSRSAIEWIMERYQVKVDKASKVRNDPNDWSREVGDLPAVSQPRARRNSTPCSGRWPSVPSWGHRALLASPAWP